MKLTQHIGYTAPTANPLLFRTYCRMIEDANGKLVRESAQQAIDRAIRGLDEFGLLTKEELELIRQYFYQNIVFPSGRWFWIGGTDWIKQQKNYIGAYNCASLAVDKLETFELDFRGLLMGCGMGTVIELDKIAELPSIKYSINLVEVTELGSNWEEGHPEFDNSNFTAYAIDDETLGIVYSVGDSKEGWVDIATDLLEFSFTSLLETNNKRWNVDFSYFPEDFKYKQINLSIDLSYVRPKGIPLKGFGGLSNPERLEKGLKAIIQIINNSLGRKFSSVEVAKILGIHAIITVAGEIRRSAKLNHGSPEDEEFVVCKDNLWVQDKEGNWKIDPERDMLRMANHTLSYHNKPDLQTVVNAVRKQYFSGEGAIQYTPEAIARCNVDLLDTDDKKRTFIALYCDNKNTAGDYLEYLSQENGQKLNEKERKHRLNRYFFNPCAEIIGNTFLCVSGDTLLITRKGLYSIKDLEGLEIEVWNGERWSNVRPIKTGSNRKLLRINFSDGSKLETSENHRFLVKKGWQKNFSVVEAKDLVGFNTTKDTTQTKPFKIEYEDGVEIEPQLAYTLGVMVGDGSSCGTRNTLVLHGDKKYLPILGRKTVEKQYVGYAATCVEVNGLESLDMVLIKTLKNSDTGFELISSWSKNSLLHFFAGLADTDGSNTAGNGIRIYVSKYERIRRLQLLLTLCDVKSSINLMAKKGHITNKGTRKEDLYYLQITDCGSIPCHRLDVSKGCQPKFKGRNQIVKSVEEVDGFHDTYCFEEPEFNNAVFGNTLTKNCNLSGVHLNVLDPNNLEQQLEAFKASTLCAVPLLSHIFDVEDLRYSREIDPIIGISFTGLFDFFVNKFGKKWLEWWKMERSKDFPLAQYFLNSEEAALKVWKNAVKETVEEYCSRNGIKQPNRYTTVQPSGSLSLLTGASPGWHPPKATRYIRRITFAKSSPVANACIDYGYKVVPSQSCKDDLGNLLNDINDIRVTEVLVEIPIEVSWADIADEVNYNPSENTALAQLDFYMQVQKHYSTHTTSATIELSEHEIEPLGEEIYRLIQNDEGYISAALLAKFDSLETFPRLPFEPISKERYIQECQDVLSRRTNDNFLELVNFHTTMMEFTSEAGSAGCDSDKCLMPEKR